MTAGLHLHLFYPDVALELIGQVAALGPMPVIVTHSGPLDPDVAAALDALAGPVERVEVPNLGWDLGPLLHILPQVEVAGWDLVGHLHTKKGDSGYAAEWRGIARDGMIADGTLVARLADAFAADPALVLAGPAALYKSAASHQFRNGEILSTLAPRLLAPLYPPADWGFFAGSFFWARPALLRRLAPLVRFADGEEARDGTLAHALERLVGLAPLATGGRIALVGEDGALDCFRAPGAPSHEPIIRTLVDRAERFVAPIDPALADLIRRHNPLADYARHGRDADALDPNPYFSSDWYNRIQADVFAAGMHPLHHYMHHGWPEGRSTGPLFDGRHYRAAYDDVTGDPLRHFLATGAREGRVAIPVSRPADAGGDERPRRFYRHFDIVREEAFLAEMAALPAALATQAAATRVSVIMPVWNRAATVGAAIRSVLGQTHAALELIVVDDGSTDETRAIAAALQAEDPRVRLVEAAHGGVSAARNLGLAAATGEIVAYLDSDNRWVAWFLEVMLRHLVAGGLDAAYAGIALRDDLGQLTGYRGDEFDWEACLRQNYVDLNAFCHRRSLGREVGGFDPKLRRMVDWDFILRVGRGRTVGYAPFVGCDYFDGRADPARITTTEPAAYQKLVWTKNRYGLETGTAAFRDRLRLAIAIKIAAPEAERAAWGDFHFAESLAEAFARLGHDAVIDFRGQWTGRPTTEEDVVLVLRGLIPYEPRPGQLALLWAISHPDQIGPAEMDAYARVYVASESHAALLRHVLRVPVAPLRQATDPARFAPVADAPAGPKLLFVGNSRGVERDVVRWAVEAGHAPTIVGGGWDGLVPAQLVEAETVDNRALGRRYAGAGAVLNDHWPSMRAFGYLSNRLYDAAASGARIVSDPVPSMTATFGDAVAEVDGPGALAAALPDLLARPRDLALAERIARDESFDARARVIVDDVMAMLGVADSVPAAPRAALRVHAVVPFAPHGPRSSAYIRLACPLTDETLAYRVALSLGPPEEPVPDCAVCIVQRTALADVAAVDALVGLLGARNTRLVTDVDDAFVLMDGNHPEHDAYRPLNVALERAIAASAETWFSTAPLARAYAHVAHRRVVLANGIDPRLWRDWRHPRAARFDGGPLRLLCMGTNTHGADFATLRSDLDGLWARRPGSFIVTTVGMAPDLSPAPWLHRLTPPADAVSYPRFVHWLRAEGPFDCGLAPLADTPFNRAKSDIKLLDYAALGLLPIASPLPGYAADAALAALAVTATDWGEAVETVMLDPAAARIRAADAQAHVWAHRSSAAVGAAMLARLEALLS